VLEKTACGGWPNVTGTIENYPGFPKGINGVELSARFKEQALRFGATIREYEEATSVMPGERSIAVTTQKNSYSGKTVIVASGSSPRRLDVPGERALTGRGVSYCAVCDGPLFRNRDVAVIGGGNAALEEALFLTKFASRVHVVHRRNEFRGAKILEEQLLKTGKAHFELSSVVLSINGRERVESVSLLNKETGNKKELDVAGVFIFVGVTPNTVFLKDTVALDETAHVDTDASMKSSRSGVFAAGDVRAGNLRQIAIACGDGTTAAFAVRDHLKKRQSDRTTSP
jgi:thioredoxin reductase (NADPH)